MLAGATDFNRQVGMSFLLNRPTNSDKATISRETERKILYWMVSSIPIQRTLKMFVKLREGHVNNARTRKLILHTLLNGNIEWWAMKYRKKMRQCLEHAWGKRTTSIIRSIVDKISHTAKEVGILNTNIDRFVKSPNGTLYQCISFILGNNSNFNVPMLVAFEDAKDNLDRGKELPPEVLEGLRSTYHKDTRAKEVLSLTKDSMSKAQRMNMQRKAKKEGVKVDFDPHAYDAVKLYTYAYEMGMTGKIDEALNSKAKTIAKQFPAHFEKVGMVIDASESMMGSDTQALRPMAIALATRDALQHVAEDNHIEYCGGKANRRLVKPSGSTPLAQGVLNCLKAKADAVFIITDGYENEPAGRVGEIINAARGCGIKTPVYQVTPVLAAESSGMRKLSEEVIALPVSDPRALGLPLLRAQFEVDTKQGVDALLNMTMPLLEDTNNG